MQIVISNKIIVYDAPKSLMQYCREHLILRNPDFYKRQAMGKWTGGTPEHIWLYEQFGKDIYMPFGCLSDVWSMFPDQRLYKIEIGRLQPRRYTSNINLYEYQQKAEIANQELNKMISNGICLTDEQEAYIIADAKVWATKTMIVVGENWSLEMAPLRFEAAMLAVKAEELKVPLSPEQKAYAHKFNEVNMYLGTVSVLEKWLELNSPTSLRAE